MFGRKRDGVGSTTAVGHGAEVEGSLKSDQDIHIDGLVNGIVESAGAVSIGTNGIVRGSVRGETVTIGGRVEGTVTAATFLHMLATGCVQGDAVYGSLAVDRGGVIEGKTSSLTGAEAVPVAQVPPGPPRLLPEATRTLLYPPPPHDGSSQPRMPSAPPPHPEVAAGSA